MAAVHAPRRRAHGGHAGGSAGAGGRGGPGADVDLIWDEVCCSCANEFLAVGDATLQVAPCGHKFCATCASRLPKRGSTRCVAPGCAKLVARSSLSEKSAEVRVYEAEVKERKRLARIFNKPPSAFPTMREYNDYLELVETYLMNLVDGIDVEKTNAAIQEYIKANAHTIVLHESQRTDSVRAQQAAVMREREAAAAAQRDAKRAEALRREQVSREKSDIARVAVGDKSAFAVSLIDDVDPATGVARTGVPGAGRPSGQLSLDTGSTMALRQAGQPRPVNGAKILKLRRLPPPESSSRAKQRLASGYSTDLVLRRELDDLRSSMMLAP